MSYEYYKAVSLLFWDGTALVKIVYNGVANSFWPGWIWPLGWWGVSTPERSAHGVYALRSAGGYGAIEVWARIDDDTALRNTHYTFQNVAAPGGLPASDRYIKFTWAVGEIGIKGIPVEILNTDAPNLKFGVVFVGARQVGGSFTAWPRPLFIWDWPALSYVPDNYDVTVQQRPDEKGIVGFLQPKFVFNESQVVTIPVYRQAGSVGAVGISYHTEDGTGVEGVDYEESIGTLSWANAESGPKNISVTLNGVGSDKTFRVVLDTPTGGVYINPQADEAEVTVVNVGGGAGRVAFTTLILQGESGDTPQVIVRRIGGTAGLITVDLDLEDASAQAGVHYTDNDQTVTFPDANDTPQNFDVALIGDEDGIISLTALLNNPVGTVIEPGWEQVTIYILPTGAPEVPPITDTLEGSFNPYTREDDVEDPGWHTRQDILVNSMQQLVAGEIGWSSGGTIHDGGSDYQTPGEFSQPTWRQKHHMTVQQVQV